MNKIEIIIINWNGLKDTIECIRSIKDSVFTDFQVLVVDNGSKENEAIKLKEQFSEIHTIRNEDNLGYAGGLNLGLRHALSRSPEFILILNNDTILDKEAIKFLLGSFDKSGKIAITCPKILNFERKHEIQVAITKADYIKGYFMIFGAGQKDTGQYDNETEIDVAPGCVMMIKKSIFDEIGIFNERYYSLHEDFEFSYRVRKIDRKILYVPAARVWHKEGFSRTTNNRLRNYLFQRNRCLFANEHLSIFQRTYFYLIFLYQLTKRMLRKQVLPGEIEGFKDGLLNKTGKPKWA